MRSDTYIRKPSMSHMGECLRSAGTPDDEARLLLDVLQRRFYASGRWVPGRVCGHDLVIMLTQALSDYRNIRRSGMADFSVFQLLRLFVDDQAVIREACDIFGMVPALSVSGAEN